MTSNDPTQELLNLTERLLNSIAGGDWATYSELCHPDLTCFEPEARGNLVSGLSFHKFFFTPGPAEGAWQTTMVAPQVRMLGSDAALVAYVRLGQRMTKEGPRISSFEETRIWQRIDGRWRHVHFHRSAPGS